MQSAVLNRKELQQRYALSRETAQHLAHTLPNISKGRKGRGMQLIVFAHHADMLLEYVAMHRLEINSFLHEVTSEKVSEIVKGVR